MPALRHELAGSVSVLRMSLAVIKRKIETGGDMVEAGPLQQRVDSLDTHIGELSTSLRRLRHWDRPSGEAMSAQTLVNEIWELAHPFLALRNIEQGPVSADEYAWPIQGIAPQPLMYLLLASIYHLAEGRGENIPQRISAAVEDEHIRISPNGSRAAEDAPMGHSTASASGSIQTPPIDRAALQCLADHLGAPLTFCADQSILLRMY